MVELNRHLVQAVASQAYVLPWTALNWATAVLLERDERDAVQSRLVEADGMSER